MTKLSTTATLNSDKILSVVNKTGFTPTNVDGFLPSTTVIDAVGTTHSKSFKLSEVLLFNILLYNPYNKVQEISNLVGTDLEPYVTISLDTDFTTKSSKTYTITKDGYYIAAQVIALDKVYYDANKSLNRFIDVDYLVYDITLKKFYHAKNGIYTELTAIEILDPDITSIDYMRSMNNIFSYIDLRQCYIDRTDTYISNLLSTCTTPTWFNEYYIVYTTLEAIKYQIEFCSFETAQKYLEWISSCSNICTSNYSITKTCNCS